KNTPSEKRELKNDRAKLFAQDIHHFEELRQFGITVHEHLVVRDRLWNFDRESKALRRSSIPVFNGSCGRAGVKGRVHLDGMKPLGIEREVVRRLHASRIEGAIPT